jgi:hypothetical protein
MIQAKKVGKINWLLIYGMKQAYGQSEKNHGGWPWGTRQGLAPKRARMREI